MVSIIIPTYNRAYCLRQTIDSIVAQTYRDWEAVIVDDGSTDDTRQMIADSFGHDPRIRYLYQINAGVSNARNTGIAQSSGNFVAFLDSDDIWQPWKLAAQMQCLHNHPEIGMVWTDMEAIDPQGSVIDPRHLRTMYSAYRYFQLDTLFETRERVANIAPSEPSANLYVGDIYPAMIMGSLVHTSTVLMRRERLDQVGGFDESLTLSGEDYDFHLRTCKWGPVALLDIASIAYQKGRPDHLSNQSGATAGNFLATLQRAIHLDKNPRRFPPKSVRSSLANAHAWVAHEQFKLNQDRTVRHHALRSLVRRPLQPRLLALFCLACVPRSTRSAAIGVYRRLKRRLKQRPAAEAIRVP
jgi:glycosyltransferase involved in cell wall biosynthesis